MKYYVYAWNKNDDLFLSAVFDDILEGQKWAFMIDGIVKSINI